MRIFQPKFYFNRNYVEIDLPVLIEDLDEDAMDRGELVSFDEVEGELAHAEWAQGYVDNGFYDPQEQAVWR